MVGKRLNKKVKAKLFLFFATLGVYALFIAIWQGLELYYYGEVQPSIVDSIIGVFIFYSFYLNVKHCLIRLWTND